MAGDRSEERARRVREVVEREGRMTLASLCEEVTGRYGSPVWKVVYELALCKRTRVEKPKHRPHIWLVSEEWREDMLRSDELLLALLRLRRTDTRRAHSRAELGEFLKKRYQAAFRDAFEQREARGWWPAGVGGVVRNGPLCVFLLDDLVQREPPRPAHPSRLDRAAAPSAAPAEARSDRAATSPVSAETSSGAVRSSHAAEAPSRSATSPVSAETSSQPHATQRFAEAFVRAFEALDAERQGSNRVPLRDLRAALSAWSHEAFDRELNELRRADRFVLEASEGRYGGYDPSLAEAGITELGRRYVYVARKRHG